MHAVPPQTTGAELVAMLSSRHPDVDWLAALAKGAVMSRADVEDMLSGPAPLPAVLIDAASDLDRTIVPGDPTARDDVFGAQTNDADSPMEVDAEAGLTTVPSSKPHPSRSNSLNEMGERTEDYQNDV